MPEPAAMAVLQMISDASETLARVRFIVLAARHAQLPATDQALLARLGVARVYKLFELDEVLAALRVGFACLAP